MGHQLREYVIDPLERRRFVKRVLADLRVLERMIAEDRFESGVRRIGAEQEIVLIDRHGRPAPVGLEVLERLDADAFTTELSVYDIEYNAPPLAFGGDCLRRLERHLRSAFDAVVAAAAEVDARPILTGILPTLRKNDLGPDSVTPRPRYRSLVDALCRLRGEAYEFRFTGIDELIMRHPSVTLEAANTSAQFHFQVAPDEFVRLFNLAQAVAAPVLAVAVNSPLLFGRRLWQETRIALFQQAIDTRRPLDGIQERSARVRLGERWVRDSVIDLYREDIARFRILLAERVDESPDAVLESGGVPKLRALQLHNGTVYRWNRACYGVTGGRPHLRIENRVLPSGPTIVDEVANAAFWFGLIAAYAGDGIDVTEVLDFDDARNGFLAAARFGLDAPIRWLDGRTRPAAQLIGEELADHAHRGLVDGGVDVADADRFIGIIRARAASGRTGARWLLDAVGAHRRRGSRRFHALDAIVASMWEHQQEGRPVHEWPSHDPGARIRGAASIARVDQLMTTDVFTVHEDDIIDLAASLMDWKHVRHVPVEDDEHRLVGLVTYRQLLRFLAADLPHGAAHPVTVGAIMQRDPVTVEPETSTLDAMALMRERAVPCLPVVRGERIVGILTERDFIPVAAALLEEKLRDPE